MRPKPSDYGAIDEGVLPDKPKWVFDDEDKEKAYNDAWDRYEGGDDREEDRRNGLWG